MSETTDRCICEVSNYRVTVLDALNNFCKAMFDEEREVDCRSFTGTPFSSNGMLFRLVDGINTYKIIHRSKTHVFEFYEVKEVNKDE